LKYAQQDTHYLLYIFDKIVNDLLSASNEQSTLVKGVYHDSKILCMKRYLKPIINENSYKDMFLKSKRSFNNQQIYALREIFLWRDKIAREEDESCGYILPNHMLLQIAESLPREMQGILACCNPIPPMIRQNLNHLHQIILKAREQPIIKPIINDKDAVRQTVNLNNKRDLLNHPLYSPHDLSHQQEIRDDLPTLIGNNKLKESFKDIIINEISLNVFDKNQNGYVNSQKELEIKFISPYHRYKLMIPFMEAQRKKEQAEAEENRKKMLEEKKKQLPELEIVKIGNDEDVEEVPLRVIKRKSDGPSQQQQQFQNKRWRKEDKRESEVPNNDANEMDIESKLKEVATVVENMKNKNKKFNKKGKVQKASDFRQNSNKPVPFDYSTVSYDRFQGGSNNGNSNQKDQKNSQKFKGGKKSKGGNNIDKMFNFSNFKLNKK
jgi:exosome complex exonuclease RRP6